MPQFYDSIPSSLAAWATEQPVFFVSSAPLRGKHINVSPKGMADASFAIMSPKEAAYIDVTGSGNETIAHLRENGRVTVMFCSFEATPRILRLFCTGRVIETQEEGAFRGIVQRMGERTKVFVGTRAVIVLDIFKVQTSCGFAVPRLALTVDPETNEPTATLAKRDTWLKYVEKMDSAGKVEPYRAEWNVKSLDGLPGLESARAERGGLRLVWWGRVSNWARWYRSHIEWALLVAVAASHFCAQEVFSALVFALAVPLLVN